MKSSFIWHMPDFQLNPRSNGHLRIRAQPTRDLLIDDRFVPVDFQSVLEERREWKYRIRLTTMSNDSGALVSPTFRIEPPPSDFVLHLRGLESIALQPPVQHEENVSR